MGTMDWLGAAGMFLLIGVYFAVITKLTSDRYYKDFAIGTTVMGVVFAITAAVSAVISAVFGGS